MKSIGLLSLQFLVNESLPLYGDAVTYQLLFDNPLKLTLYYYRYFLKVLAVMATVIPNSIENGKMTHEG